MAEFGTSSAFRGCVRVKVKFWVMVLDCQTSKTRVRARLEIRTGRLAHTASRQGARSASEMQSCWLDKVLECK